MTVYVDKAHHKFRRMIMCHMLADTLEELHAMADKIGLDRRHFQQLSSPHYDLCKAFRKKAIDAGAKEVDRHELVTVIRANRGHMP